MCGIIFLRVRADNRRQCISRACATARLSCAQDVDLGQIARSLAWVTHGVGHRCMLAIKAQWTVSLTSLQGYCQLSPSRDCSRRYCSSTRSPDHQRGRQLSKLHLLFEELSGVASAGNRGAHFYRDEFVCLACCREEAYESLANSPFFKAWNPAVLRSYVDFGMTENEQGEIVLKCSGYQVGHSSSSARSDCVLGGCYFFGRLCTFGIIHSLTRNSILDSDKMDCVGARDLDVSKRILSSEFS